MGLKKLDQVIHQDQNQDQEQNLSHSRNYEARESDDESEID